MIEILVILMSLGLWGVGAIGLALLIGAIASVSKNNGHRNRRR